MIFLSLQETLPGSIDDSKLELHPIEDITKVQNPNVEDYRFKQPLTYNDHKLMLSTEAFRTKKLILSQFDSGTSILVPIKPWLRKQLDIIEEFVTLHVDLPTPFKESWKARSDKDTPYKKLWDGDNMYIPMSHWCKQYHYAPDTALQYTMIDQAVGEGTYTITFEVPNVYFAQHSDNKLISLTLRVIQIVFQPAVPNINQIIEAALSAEGVEEKQQEPSKRRRRSKKVTSSQTSHKTETSL